MKRKSASFDTYSPVNYATELYSEIFKNHFYKNYIHVAEVFYTNVRHSTGTFKRLAICEK